MKEYALLHFGNLATENLEESYDANIEISGNEIRVDLNFENKTIDTKTLDKVRNLLENIEEYDTLNKSYILSDYNNEDGDTVKFYLQHHLEEIGEEELAGLINFEDKTRNIEQQLLKKLNLVRVGLYPDNEENFAVFDYSIGEEITNYLVVISTDWNGQLDYMAMES